MTARILSVYSDEVECCPHCGERLRIRPAIQGALAAVVLNRLEEQRLRLGAKDRAA